MAAEGGFDDRTPLITHDDKNTDSNHEEATELDETGGFEPGQASTPYGEKIHMQTRQHEQFSGRPSDEETSFGGGELHSYEEIKRRWEALKFDKNTGIVKTTDAIPGLTEDLIDDEFKIHQKESAIRFIKRRYPQFKEKSLVISSSSKNPLVLVTKGPKGGETPIFLKDGSDFQRNFLDKTYVKNALGKPAESIIKQATDDIREKQKKLNEIRQEQKRYHEQKEEKEKEVLDLQRRLHAEVEKQQQLQDDPAADKNLLKQKKP